MAGFSLPRHRFPPMRNRRSPACTPRRRGFFISDPPPSGPGPHLFATAWVLSPFIVAPLLPRLCRPVDGEIRAKNSGGTVVKARNSGRAFILCRSTLRLSEMPSKPDRPSPSSSETPQSCNVLVGHVAACHPTSSPTSDCSPRILAAARRRRRPRLRAGRNVRTWPCFGALRSYRKAEREFVNLRGPA